jgi:hypothetical protein
MALQIKPIHLGSSLGFLFSFLILVNSKFGFWIQPLGENWSKAHLCFPTPGLISPSSLGSALHQSL